MPRGNGRARFQKDLFGKIWRFTTGMSGISVVGILLTQIDKIVLGRILPLNIFGYYSLASLVSSGVTRLTVPIFQAYFPKLSQLVGKGDEKTIAQTYHQGCQLMAAVIFPIAAMLVFFPAKIMFLWQQDAETAQNTYLLVSLLAIGSALNAALIIPYALQLSYGWVKLNFYALTIAVSILIPLTIIFALNFGVAGAATVWMILNAALIVFMIPFMHQRILSDQKWKWYGRDVFQPLMAVLMAASLGRYFFIESAAQALVITQLSVIFLLTFAAACLASGYPRRWITGQVLALYQNRWLEKIKMI